MMKKGASHVDWAIGTGLFVVFVMLTLTFLRPGTEPVYKGDVLLKIIEDGLKNDTYYTIEKQFLMVEPISISTGEYKIRIRNPTSDGLNPDWKTNKEHLGLVNSSLGTVPSEELLYTPYDLDDEYCTINPSSCLSDVLDINTRLINNETNIFWFLYSQDTDPTSVDVSIGFPSNPNEGCFKDGTCLLDGENFTSKFGVSEILEGFSEEKLHNLEAVNYDTLKDSWNIPLDKEFKIAITNLTAYTPYKEMAYKDGINFLKEGTQQAPTGVSVFVKEWKGWVLTPKGGLLPVEVHMELW